MRRVAIATVLVGTLLGAGAGAVKAVQPHGSHPAWAHVVQQGETLWQIASEAAPTADRRITVDRLIAVNHLADPIIRPGQRLILPR